MDKSVNFKKIFMTGLAAALLYVSSLSTGIRQNLALSRASLEGKENMTIEKQIAKLSVLNPSDWQELDFYKKLDTLQLVIDVTAADIGLPYQLSLRAGKIDSEAYYNNANRLIVINRDLVKNAPSSEAVRVVMHELFHAVEHRMVDLKEMLPNTFQTDSLIDSIERYKEEFTNYKTPEKDGYIAYSHQLCELDAEVFAELKSEAFFGKLYDLLEKEGFLEGMDFSMNELIKEERDYA